MIRFEDSDFVEEILDSESCIILPFEVSQYADGRVDMLVYPICGDIASEFERLFSADPFTREAADYLMDKLAPAVEQLGYSVEGADTHAYREYRCDNPDTAKILPECPVISTLEGEEWDGIELDGFELDPDNQTDRMAVIRCDDKIVCYAGLNDLSEDDGLYEITVECEEDYRGRGYASSCTAKLTEYLISLGEGVKYVCAEDHIISRKTAEAAGYYLYRKVFPFVCVRKDGDEEDEE